MFKTLGNVPEFDTDRYDAVRQTLEFIPTDHLPAYIRVDMTAESRKAITDEIAVRRVNGS